MSRAIPLLAVLCTGIALGALIVAVVGATRADPSLIEEVAPLDAAAAVPEIAQIRESRGSVLAGTSLGKDEGATEFADALAIQTGASTVEPQSLVEQLRGSAQNYEQQAQRLEERAEFAQADELRRLAEDSRHMARSLSGGEIKSRDLRTGFFSARSRQ